MEAAAQPVGLGPPVDRHEGNPVRVRFLWDSRPAEPTWEQAFSTDGGETWETNWQMALSRVE